MIPKQSNFRHLHHACIATDWPVAMWVELATWLFSEKAEQTKWLKLGQQKYLGAVVPIEPNQNWHSDFTQNLWNWDTGTIFKSSLGCFGKKNTKPVVATGKPEFVLEPTVFFQPRNMFKNGRQLRCFLQSGLKSPKTIVFPKSQIPYRLIPITLFCWHWTHLCCSLAAPSLLPAAQVKTCKE